MDVAKVLSSFSLKVELSGTQKDFIFLELGSLSFFLQEKRSAKGQMFFISAIFMIVGLVMMAGLLTLPEITQEKLFQETSYADKNLKNVRNEYEYLTGLATLQPEPNSTGPQYMYNFSNLIRNNLDSNILYVAVFSNGTTRNFSVAIGNFLQDRIDGNISFSYGESALFSLNDKTHVTHNFSGTDGIVTVTLNYTVQNSRVGERFTFNDSARNYAAAFFDISVWEGEFLVRSKSLYNRTW